MYKDLKGKTAIITGARRGMGKSHALKLAEAGCNVVVSDISEEDCQKVVKEIKGEALAVKCDVSKKADVENLVRKTVEKFGKIDSLVNNAGIAAFKPFMEMTEEDWDKTIDINLKGYFLCAKACAKEMAKRKKGVIVNIASIAMGQVGVGYSNLVHYCV
jgi:3-oxoacyl-[acyl-carrier protein] reductase